MLHKQVFTAMLLADLGLLAFIAGALTFGASSAFMDAWIVAYLLLSSLTFYAAAIQDTLRIELSGFIAGFAASGVFAVAALFGAPLVVDALLGSLCVVTTSVNVVTVQNSRRVEPKLSLWAQAETPTLASMPPAYDAGIDSSAPANTSSALESSYQRFSTPTAIMMNDSRSQASVTELLNTNRMSQMAPTQSAPNNIVNVKIDAPNSAAPQDNTTLLLNDLEIKNSLDKVDDKIDEQDVRTQERIARVKDQINASFADVKKEIETMKEKKRLFIASRNGKKMHTPGCMVADRIPEIKRIMITDYEEAVLKGYSACGVCHPTEAVAIERTV